MITLVKFIRNRVQNTDNYLITRTLGKIGVVKKELFATMDPRPRHDEFWYAEILGEVRPNEAKGCWILQPLRPIGTTSRRGYAEPDIVRLIPGTFDVEKRGNTLYVYPHKVSTSDGPNWILDTEVRKQVIHQYRGADGQFAINSIIVLFDEQKGPPIVAAPSTSPSQSTDPLIDFEAMAEELERE